MIFCLILTVRGPFKWKKIWGYGINSQKTEALYAELNERAEAAISSYSVTDIFYNIFILCLWLRIIRTANQGVSFMNFPSEIFFNDINHGYRAAMLKKIFLWLLPFYMSVATHFYYEKVCRKMRTAVVSYLLKRPALGTSCFLFSWRGCCFIIFSLLYQLY